MNNTTYYQRNREIILPRAKNYDKNNKEKLREQTRDKYRDLSEEEKIKKRECGKTDTITCLKKKNKLKEYQKNYREAKKVNNKLICKLLSLLE